MNPFTLVSASDSRGARQALGHVAQQPRITRPQFIAGGTNVLDLMKAGVTQPSRLVDISGLGLDGIEWSPEDGLRLGATAHNADTAYHPLVSEHAPCWPQRSLPAPRPRYAMPPPTEAICCSAPAACISTMSHCRAISARQAAAAVPSGA